VRFGLQGLRILADEAKREFARELIVPLGTDDVIIEDAGPRFRLRSGEQ